LKGRFRTVINKRTLKDVKASTASNKDKEAQSGDKEKDAASGPAKK
jgi:hypothetical protein